MATISNTKIRPPAVAGYFYPADRITLEKMIEKFMQENNQDCPPPKAIIAPHAGYIYSGAIAASAYATLLSRSKAITKVVLLGPAHRVFLRGLALSTATHFSTPLGNIEIDQESVGAISELPQVIFSDEAHAQEHSLEVHLPYLQTILDKFLLLPLVVGNATPEEIAEVLDILWGGDETLIVISSDLSHYHDYATAEILDKQTSQVIESLDYKKLNSKMACGYMPIRGLLKVAENRSMQVKIIDLRNSGDTAGPPERVVGYGAFTCTEM